MFKHVFKNTCRQHMLEPNGEPKKQRRNASCADAKLTQNLVPHLTQKPDAKPDAWACYYRALASVKCLMLTSVKVVHAHIYQLKNIACPSLFRNA